jgi:hypothetical protein
MSFKICLLRLPDRTKLLMALCSNKFSKNRNLLDPSKADNLSSHLRVAMAVFSSSFSDNWAINLTFLCLANGK